MNNTQRIDELAARGRVLQEKIKELKRDLERLIESRSHHE